GWQLLAGTRSHVLDVTFPPGVSLGLAAQQQLLVQSASMSRKGGKGRPKILFFPTKPDDVTAHAGALFADDRSVQVTSGSTVAGTCRLTGTSDFGRELTLIALAGHYHKRGTSFTVTRQLADGTPGEVLYEHHGAGAPPLVRFSDKQPVVLEPGESLVWQCTYE